MTTPFTRQTLAFLRALKRNNDREWFRARQDEYERHVRGPMLEVLARLDADFRKFAPELVADPKVSLFRIYRDTRFSADKSPLKTQIGARFPPLGFERGRGSGLYFEIAPQWVWIGGGLYRPSTADLQAVREHIAATHPRLHRIVTARPFTGTLGGLEGEQLTRPPRGYPPDHPAGPYLRFKQFLAGRQFDAEFALDERFYPELVRTFRQILPLVRFLNTALEERSAPPRPEDRAPEW